MRGNKLRITIDPLFFLILALFVGEASLEIIGINISLSSSMMYLVCIVGFFLLVMSRKKKSNRKISFMSIGLIYGYIFLRNILSEGLTYEEYIIPNLVTCFIIYIIFKFYNTDTDIEKIINYMYILTLMLVLLGSIKFLSGDIDRLAVFGGPNGYYKLVFVNHVIVFYKLLEKFKIRYLLLLLLTIILAIATGSKGAILTMIIIIPIEYIYYLMSNSKSLSDILKSLLLLGIVTGIFLGVMVIVLNNNSELNAFYKRSIGLFGPNSRSLTSVDSRVVLYDFAWKSFLQHPIFGMGAMQIYFQTRYTAAPQPYAHNIFLEMLSEEGTIGFLLLLLPIIVVYLKNSIYGFISKNNLIVILFLFGLVYIIGAQVSGNLLDFKMFMLSLVCLKNTYANKKLL